MQEQQSLAKLLVSEVRAVARAMDHSPDLEKALKMILLGVYERGKEAGKLEERERLRYQA